MAGWLHGVFVGEWLFIFPLCGFSLSLFCNYGFMHAWPFSLSDGRARDATPAPSAMRTSTALHP